MGLLQLHLFSPPSLLVQAILALVIESPISLAKLGAMATIICLPLLCLSLVPDFCSLIFSSIFLFSFYFLFNICLNLLPFYTTVQNFWLAILLLSTFFLSLYSFFSWILLLMVFLCIYYFFLPF